MIFRRIKLSTIQHFLAALDTADRQEPSVAQARTARLQDKMEALKTQMRALNEVEPAGYHFIGLL